MRKGKGVETRALGKEEKEEKVDFGSGLKWERGYLLGEPLAPKRESKADLSWAAGLGKLKVTEVGDMGYCNSCRMMGGGDRRVLQALQEKIGIGVFNFAGTWEGIGGRCRYR